MKRLHRCLTCQPQEPTPEVRFPRRRGFTRHDDRICAACRREGHSARDGVVRLNVDLRYGDSELRRPDHKAGRGGW